MAAASLGAGIALGRPQLVGIAGVLFGALALSLCWLLVARQIDRARLTARLRRRMTPNPAHTGQPIELRIELPGQLPGGVVSEQVPPAVSIEQIGTDGVFGLRATRRGRHPIGPVMARRRDPLELFTVGYPIAGSQDLVAWPRLAPLASRGPGGELGRDLPAGFGGLLDSAPDDVVLREYRTGDDLRRVHWRASARHGDLLVRGEEATARTTCTVALLVSPDEDQAEWSIQLAASWLAALIDARQRPQLVHATSTLRGPLPDLLTALADIVVPPIDPLAEGYAAIDALTDDGHFLLAVLPPLPDLARRLAAVRSRRAAAVIAAGNQLPDGVECMRIMRSANWLACLAPPGTSVAQAHRELFAGERIRP